MHIQTRLRPGRDQDIETWYLAQEDKSAAVRDAIRAFMRSQNGDTQAAVIKRVVAEELAKVPDVLAGVVSDALAAYQFAPVEMQERKPGEEDPVLAARLDAQLGEWFDDED